MFFNNVRVVGDTVMFSANRIDDGVPMVKVLSVNNRWYACEVPFNNVEDWTIETKVTEEVDTYEGPTSGYGNLRVLISKGTEAYVYNLIGYMDCGIFNYRESFTTGACCPICSDMWGMCECIPCRCGFGTLHDVSDCTTTCVVCEMWIPECICAAGLEPVVEETFGYWEYTCTCGAPDGCCDC